MTLETSLLTLMHVLVFVYWLGGDIGVFYSSTLLTDNKRDTSGRLTAGKILADLDLIPRFCLLLTVPTGLALAAVKGWLDIPEAWLVVAFIAAFVWIYIVWCLHVHHNQPASLKGLDTILRVIFLIVLAGCGTAGLVNAMEIPLFVSLKLLILAFAIAMGLMIRRALGPFGPAYIKLATEGADEETNQIIKSTLSKARPAVVMIWVALILAAWLGIAAPT